ncbi:MAG: tRNA threonylcarbamoyladenosine biosynthesis protein [Peptococcaceae bacterium BICA1-7]|nr:MAG: tRNA threonylcarbamoyladenosine biosynthesis protein [Peptococcaceae bacterium BICA1-7]
MDDQKTFFWKVDAICPDPEIIRQAGLILRRGGLVAFPTETVYGLGANALDVSAVERIFTAKGRPQDNPLIVHVSGIAPVYEYTFAIPQKARLLMEKFWPGPLTLILRGNGRIPGMVSGGLPDVAFRMPDHAVALALIQEAGVPVAAPSANLSGRPSTTTAGHVLADMDGRIEAILDGGASGMGVESTVLDMTGDIPVVLRPGGITPSQIRTVTGAVTLDKTLLDNVATPTRPRSPGMKYRHYAPSAPLVLVEGSPDMIVREIIKLAGYYAHMGKKVGILCRDGHQDHYPYLTIVAGGEDPASVAVLLFSALRLFEGTGVDIILAEGVEARGMGLAVANRLRRAAGGNVIKAGQNPVIPTFSNIEYRKE